MYSTLSVLFFSLSVVESVCDERLQFHVHVLKSVCET